MVDATARSSAAHRIGAIDFAKGVLVVAMVVYHALNYLGYDTLPHDYMAFVPMSFTMIAGFLIMQMHSDSREPPLSVSALRLASRASKLLIIFTTLNVGARAIWSRNHYGTELSVHDFVTHWFDVYVTGQSKAAAFPVLVPIGYTLLLSIGILALRRRSAMLPAIVAAVLFAAGIVLERRGDLFYNIQFISAGVIGLAMGTIDLNKVNDAVDSRLLWAALIIAYLGVLLLRLDNYVSQLFITIVTLTMLYAAGRRVSADRWLARQVCLLGRYTLFSYIVQILFLQGARAIDRASAGLATAAMLVCAVTLLMWASVRIVEFGRSKASGFDRLYRFVFV
jgi:uncharacterized membrane protein